MRTSEKGLELIRKFEGLMLTAYQCAAGRWTIGYGSTFYEDGTPVKKGDKISREKAESLLKDIVQIFEEGVNKLVKVPLNQNQFDALVSFAFNVGLTNLGNSTLLRKLNKSDYLGASLEFVRWNKAAGKVLDGLTKRRQQETTLFKS